MIDVFEWPVDEKSELRVQEVCGLTGPACHGAWQEMMAWHDGVCCCKAQALAYACRMELDAISGFLNQQDHKALQEGRLSGRRKLAARFQVEKRKILESCVARHSSSAQRLEFSVITREQGTTDPPSWVGDAGL